MCAARERGQYYLLEVVASSSAAYYKRDDPNHTTARTELIGPILGPRALADGAVASCSCRGTETVSLFVDSNSL